MGGRDWSSNGLSRIVCGLALRVARGCRRSVTRAGIGRGDLDHSSATCGLARLKWKSVGDENGQTLSWRRSGTWQYAVPR